MFQSFFHLLKRRNHFLYSLGYSEQIHYMHCTTQGRRKQLGSGATAANQNAAGGLGGAVSPPMDPGQSPGGGTGGEAPESSKDIIF